MDMLMRLGGVICLMVLLQGCRIIVESSPYGFVLSESEAHNCGTGETCIFDFDGVPLSDVFIAVPSPGYQFAGWRESDASLCGGKVTACSLLNIPAALTSLTADTYLLPVFEPDTTIDTDGDGVPDALDAFPENSSETRDSDGDGIGDNADSHPDDPYLPVANDDTPAVAIINAYNADMVTYDGGAFVQLSDTVWVENNAAGAQTFNEWARDEWSIYLRDPGRDLHVQIDLYREEILDRNPNADFVLHAVTGVNPEVITGWAANRAYYDDVYGGRGGFVQLNASDWVQNAVDGGYFRFVEVDRDDWSVFLYDASRGIHIQLDYYLDQVKYSSATTQNEVIGTITDADPDRPEEISALVVREIRTDHTYFLLNEPRRWVETLADGTQYFFDESYRDEWSIKMSEPVRGINIWIDLHTDLVQYYFNSGEDWAPYEFPDAIPIPGPIAWYTFDGGTPGDSTGRNAPLTGSAGGVYSTAGARNEGIYLTGQNSWADLPDGIVRKLDDFTIAAFVKPDQLDTWSRIFDFGDGGNNRMYLTPKGSFGFGRLEFGLVVDGVSRIIQGVQPLTTTSGYAARAFGYTMGSFVQLNQKDWVNNSIYGVWHYVETGRDRWNVYLERADDSTKTVRLDFFSREAIMTTPLQNYLMASYAIYNPLGVDGWMATRVSTDFGRTYAQIAPTKWVEDRYQSGDGHGSYTFEEVKRTDTSVFLRPQGSTAIYELNLVNKYVVLWDAAYSQFANVGGIVDSTPWRASFDWVHVVVTKEGDVGRLYVNGEEVGVNPAMTVSPSDMGITTNNFIGRSQDSQDPYLKGAIDDFRIYNRALSLDEINTIAANDPQNITFMGTTKSFTRTELRAALAVEGYVLNDFPNGVVPLKPGECATDYGRADEKGNHSQIGALACVTIGDLPSGYRSAHKLSFRPIYGGCEKVSTANGVDCEAGSATGKFEADLGNGVTHVTRVDGPRAGACAALSSRNTCLSGGVDVVAVSQTFKSESGSGGSLGMGVGLGAGLGGGIDDGDLVVGGSLKLGVGVDVEIVISEEDIEEVATVAESGWVSLEGQIVGVGNKALAEFKHFGNEVHDIGGDIVGGLEANGQTVIFYVNDFGQSAADVFAAAERAISSAADDIAAGGLADTAGVVLQGYDSATSGLTTFVGAPVVEVVNYCTVDWRNCVPARFGGYL